MSVSIGWDFKYECCEAIDEIHKSHAMLRQFCDTVSANDVLMAYTLNQPQHHRHVKTMLMTANDKEFEKIHSNPLILNTVVKVCSYVLCGASH
jgi:hypothetical protein